MSRSNTATPTQGDVDDPGNRFLARIRRKTTSLLAERRREEPPQLVEQTVRNYRGLTWSTLHDEFLAKLFPGHTAYAEKKEKDSFVFWIPRKLTDEELIEIEKLRDRKERRQKRPAEPSK